MRYAIRTNGTLCPQHVAVSMSTMRCRLGTERAAAAKQDSQPVANSCVSGGEDMRGSAAEQFPKLAET